jgi:CdiI immunity protein
MKRVPASDFPALRSAFSGYLHEDFLDDYDTPAAALRAFEDDADEDERRRFRVEATRFLAVTASLDFADVLLLLSRLGSRWTPPTREALIAALTGAADR